MEAVEFLAKVDLFKSLNRDFLEHLASKTQLRSLPEGPIIKENDPVDGLYIIKAGAAKVTKAAGGGQEAPLALLRPGNTFGELGLIDGEPRSATVTALQKMECYLLPRDAFLKALEEHPEIAVSMLPVLARMVRNANQWIANLA